MLYCARRRTSASSRTLADPVPVRLRWIASSWRSGLTPHRAPQAGAGADEMWPTTCRSAPASPRWTSTGWPRRFGLSAEDVSQTHYDAFGQRQVGGTRPRSTSTRWSSNSMRASAAARKAWTGSTRSPLSGEMVPTVCHRQGRGAALRAAADQPQRHVPGGQPVLQPGCRGVSRWRCRRLQRAPGGDRHALDHSGGVFRARRRPFQSSLASQRRC